jgi:hypothetical protein
LLGNIGVGNLTVVIANFATTAADGKTYQVGYYNLDVTISVGYRVKSLRGIQFRIWASDVLKGCFISKGLKSFEAEGVMCFVEKDRDKGSGIKRIFA